MPGLPVGLYESLLTRALAERLAALPDDLRARKADLRPAEAADRIAWHISRVVERAIEALPEGQRPGAGVALARSLVDRIVEEIAAADELATERPHDPASVLFGVHA